MTWWHFGAAGLLLKGAAALALVSLPEALPLPDPGAAPIVIEVRCEPVGAPDMTGAGPATMPVVCHEQEQLAVSSGR